VGPAYHIDNVDVDDSVGDTYYGQYGDSAQRGRYRDGRGYFGPSSRGRGFATRGSRGYSGRSSSAFRGSFGRASYNNYNSQRGRYDNRGRGGYTRGNNDGRRFQRFTEYGRRRFRRWVRPRQGSYAYGIEDETIPYDDPNREEVERQLQEEGFWLEEEFTDDDEVSVYEEEASDKQDSNDNDASS